MTTQDQINLVDLVRQQLGIPPTEQEIYAEDARLEGEHYQRELEAEAAIEGQCQHEVWQSLGQSEYGEVWQCMECKERKVE